MRFANVKSAIAGNRFTILSRGWILALNLISIGFLINAIVLQRYFESGFGSFADGMTLAPVSWSFLWTLAAFILNFAGVIYHPGIDVAFELIGWTLTAGIIWMLLYSVALYPGWGAQSCNYYYEQFGTGQCSKRNSHLLIASESIAAAAVLVVGFLHFILFIKACRATHRKNMAHKIENHRVLELEERVQELEARLKVAELSMTEELKH